MSLIISNKLTDKQRDFLHKLEYYGDYNLTVTQAAELIDGLVEQQKQEENQMYIEIEGEKFYEF